MSDSQPEMSNYPRELWQPSCTKKLIFTPLAVSSALAVLFLVTFRGEMLASMLVIPFVFLVLVVSILKFGTCDWKQFPPLSYQRLMTNALFYGITVGLPIIALGLTFINTD